MKNHQGGALLFAFFGISSIVVDPYFLIQMSSGYLNTSLDPSIYTIFLLTPWVLLQEFESENSPVLTER
ncbi:MAG: hypothetical protein ACFFCZ_25885 [Promethearchaeota archaeon]